MDLADFGGDAKGPVHLDTPPTMPGTPTEELHDGLTVGELARQISALPPCAIQLSLREAAQMLLSSGQAAGCVVDESGSPVGVITEDDILHSYVQGAPWDTTVGEWLRGGGGVLFDETSGAASPTARVASEQPLHAALPALVSGQRIVPSLGRSSGRSALLVERQGNYAGGVLSALDVVQALAQRASENLMGALAGTVADVMEPIDQAPRLQVGFTMRDLLKELLRTPLRAALVLDEQGHMGGLATAADALWAFNQQMSQTLDAWERLSSRPGRLAPQICTSAALSSACSAFEREGARAPLLATEPDTGDVVGLVAPSHMVEAGRRRPSRHPVPSCAPGLKQERIRKVKEERPIKEENTGVAVKLEEEVKCEEPAPKKRAVMTKPKLEIKMEDSAVPAPPPPSLAEIVARRDTALCDIEMSLTDAVDALVCYERMVNQLRRSGALRSQGCVDAFKAVDRAHFWIRGLRSEIYGTEVYGDAPLRYGKLHQSAPHIYARALEALMPLKTGMSFLNIGSGTGYFSSLVAEILGDGVNDGLELWPENVAHAQERCNMLGKHHITFNVGNVYQLDVNLGMRYSRIYIGACACPRAQYLYSLLEVGGILVGPFQSGHSQQLRRVIRESETHFKIEILNSVHFAALIEPPTSTDAGDMEQASGTPVPPPGTPVVGLPGVPFAFALRQKPWTVERNWAYPHSFRCITAALLRSKNSSGLLPMELWIEHVLPWCPRWWFDQPSEITQKSALAMLGKRMSKVFFSTSTCSTASGISDEAEGAASGDEVHFTTVTTAPGATANATAPRAPPRRSMYRIATRAVRRCLRCVARCWTTSRSTPNALQSPSDGETVPLDSRGVGTGEAEDEATQPEQSRPLGGVRWCLGSIVTPCTSLRRLLRRLVPV